MRRILACLIIGILGSIAVNCSNEPASTEETVQIEKNYLEETPAERDARMQWWREARFGMFIHWGLYSVLAGEYQGNRSDNIGEWIQSWANIPREEYEKFAPQFNPVKFDAAAWAQLAQDAGVKYLVITSKHHEGLAIFDSAVSDYDIVDATPYGKDVIAELSRECKKRGIKLCFYYSIMDWHHPSQYVETEEKHRTAGHHQNKILEDRRSEYIGYMKAQLKELVDKYDPAVLWFDGEWTDWWTEPDGKDLYNYVRSLKPSIIINNRVGKGREGMKGLNKGPGYAGDFGTPEQEIPATGLPGIDWESCMTMNDTWGYKSYDENWKSDETLIRNIVDIASKGGNYLLNVGPTAEGLIPEPSVERLEAIGRWMKVNGESIYGTQASPFEIVAWGRATQKPGKIYLQVFDWPKGKLMVPPVDSAVKRVYLLAEPNTDLAVKQSDSGLEITLPPTAPDPIASVITVELD